MTTTGLTADPRDSELAACHARIAELEEELEALDVFAFRLMLVVAALAPKEQIPAPGAMH